MFDMNMNSKLTYIRNDVAFVMSRNISDWLILSSCSTWAYKRLISKYWCTWISHKIHGRGSYLYTKASKCLLKWYKRLIETCMINWIITERIDPRASLKQHCKNRDLYLDWCSWCLANHRGIPIIQWSLLNLNKSGEWIPRIVGKLNFWPEIVQSATYTCWTIVQCFSLQWWI